MSIADGLQGKAVLNRYATSSGVTAHAAPQCSQESATNRCYMNHLSCISQQRCSVRFII